MHPFKIDETTEFGQRVLRRLVIERIAWLTTVSSNHSPHFDGDDLDGDIIVFLGEAQIDEQIPPVNTIQAFVEKYQNGLERINLTPNQFAKKYSVPIRVVPITVRGH